jgi:protein arginine kinase
MRPIDAPATTRRPTRQARAMAPLRYEEYDRWLLEESPANAVVIASRARIARNLRDQPFAPRADESQLDLIARRVGESIGRTPAFSGFERVVLEEASPGDRQFLRESYLIATELEKGGQHRLVYIGPDRDCSLMVNEEDHLRLATLAPGFQLERAYRSLTTIEKEMEPRLDLAFSEDLGYLTACPTNAGTGLRLSVLMHLPGLAILEQLELTLAELGSHGMVARGAWGEHTESVGDLYQISNEVTLGKSEERILEFLEQACRQIIEREMGARERLRQQWQDKLEDSARRAVGLLANARRMDAVEAVGLLSRARLAIGESWGVRLGHARLNHLLVQVQPGHMQGRHGAGAGADADARDRRRAELLRSIFGGQ